MKNFQKRLAGLSLGLLMTLGVGAVVGQHGTLSVKADETKSSMQVAYETAEALSKGGKTDNSVSFSGVVTGTMENSYVVQDGNYGMYVYGGSNTPPTDLAVGKKVTVSAKLTKYYGMIETSETPTATISGDGVLPSAVKVSSKTELANLKQNVLVTLKVTMPATIGTWSSTSKLLLKTAKLGEDDFTIIFDKWAYNETAGNILKQSNGKTLLLTNAITTANDTKGATTSNQVMVSEETVLSIAGKDEAETWSNTFLTKTNEVCGDGSGADKTALETVWSELKTSYASLSDDAKNYLATAAANNDGTVVEKAMARHDHIVNRYSLEKIVTGRTATSSGAHNVLPSNDNSLTITIIVLVSVLSVSLIIGTSLIVRKRKVN